MYRFGRSTSTCTANFHSILGLGKPDRAPTAPPPRLRCRRACRRPGTPAATVMILTLLPLSLVFPPPLLRTPARPVVRSGAEPRMLRNFDRCELIILSRDAALDVSTGAVRSGVRRLISEAKEESTLVALLEPADRPIDIDDPLRALLDGAPCWRLSGSEPQVAEVTALRRALCVDSPDGFGGSDGFGRAPGSAFGREPDSPRCVAIVTSLQETVAAIGAGMRTVGIPRVEGDWVDEALDGVADACLDALGEEEQVSALLRTLLALSAPHPCAPCACHCSPLHPHAPLCTPSAAARPADR